MVVLQEPGRLGHWDFTSWAGSGAVNLWIGCGTLLVGRALSDVQNMGSCAMGSSIF